MTRRAEVEQLRRARERSRFARGLGWALVALVAVAWTGGAIDFGDLLAPRRWDNLVRFLSHDVVPPDVRRGERGWGAWIAERLAGRNREALEATVALALVAAVLSGGVGLALAGWTSRRGLAADEPFVDALGDFRSPRGVLGALVRGLCVLLRAVPEYVLAFLLGGLLRDPASACLAALVVHNGGILGRLYGETLENLDQRPARAWYLAGATRATSVFGAQVPTAFGRGLTYLFVRFESCVRESTILGAVGFASLGHWIVRERAAGRYDELVLLVLLGAAVVVAADLASWVARRAVRRG